MLDNFHVFRRLLISSKSTFSKKKIFQKNSIKVSNNLDPDPARRVGPGLGLNYLQRLSAEDTSRQGVNCRYLTF